MLKVRLLRKVFNKKSEVAIYSMSDTALIKEIGNISAARIDIPSLPVGSYILKLKNRNANFRGEKFQRE